MFARNGTGATRQAVRLGMAGRSLSTLAATQSSAASRLAALGAAVVGVAAASQFATVPVVEAASPERTFIMIKPDGVQRGLIGEIIKRFEAKGYKLVAMKMITVSKPFAEQHYSDLKKKPFFNGLTSFLSSGPVVAMVWEGQDVVRQGRKLIGATNPLESEPGTIRGDNCIAIGRNIIHGSDSNDSAAAEINLWFKPEEISNWENNPWINEPARK